MDFDLICLDTFLGEGEELIDFDDLDSIFKVTAAF